VTACLSVQTEAGSRTLVLRFFQFFNTPRESSIIRGAQAAARRLQGAGACSWQLGAAFALLGKQMPALEAPV